MTRFARAKGSKSSNERAPEDSTPWDVMKEQLLQAKKDSDEAKKREEAEQQRIENYENFLKEHKSQKRKATWCDFPEVDINKPKVSKQLESQSKKKNKKKLKRPTETAQSPLESNSTEINLSTPSKKSKKKNINKDHSEIVSQGNQSENTQEVPIKETTEEIVLKSAKKKKLKKKKGNIQKPEDTQPTEINDQNDQPQGVKQKKNKNKKNKNNVMEGEPKGQNKDNGNDKETTNNIKDNQNKLQLNKKKNNKKLVDGVPLRRKPINDHSFQLIINGKEVELVRFDGFPIMKKDAERLKELKDNMINKGIPKSEVNRTLKLERRRAEKALARLKRDVCYNCRKGGHNLSDCPELKTKIPGMGAPDGVCFKCGSTEHRQFECKVQQDKEFRFATCFICKEPGHIARQCPDNPKGLYPNGGACKLCGDVTHLRKDCPTTMGQKEETSIKLQTLDSTDNLEGIEQKVNTTLRETTKKPKKIKF